MPNTKISGLTAATSAQPAQIHAVVSGSTNKRVTTQQMLVGLGIPQYVEGTCRATATVAFLPLCNIFDIYVKNLVGSSALAGGSLVRIGIGTNISRFAIVNTSGLNLYRPNDSPDGAPPGGGYPDSNNLQNVSGAIVAAAPTASAAANFIVGIGYFRV